MSSSKQILTGQIKPVSLNTIYNHVSLLKSKNISRKLVSRQQKSLSQQNNQVNSKKSRRCLDKQEFQDNMNKINNIHNNIKFNDNNVNELQLQRSQFPGIKYKNKNRKLLQFKQTDIEQTNFWASQKYIQNIPSSLKQKHLSNIKNQQKNTKNNNLKKIDKNVFQNKSNKNKFNSTNNRIYLMSGLSKIPAFPSQTLNSKQNFKNSIDKISQISDKKRPLTSSINRSKINFRVNQLPKNQNFRSKINSTLQAKQKSKISYKNNQFQQNKISQSRTSFSLIKGQEHQLIYNSEIKRFQQLYQCLSQVLSSIKQGLFKVEKSISIYANFIQNKNILFIDDFILNRQIKLQKFVRTSRLHETLSICYLFLQIAQGRINDNQSYLVNFIGHSLSNLLLIVRLYIIKQSRPEFQNSQFETALDQLEITTYGKKLCLIDDIMLRIQHNNEIITMIHKRLGRNNQKFQSCIKNFFKNAQRKNYSCSLCVHYIFEYLSMHIHQLQLLNISPTLQVAPQPYTPPSQKQYTLIIQPLGILQKNGKLRPYLNQFIKWASKNFDIILWTWQLPYAVQQIYEILSPFVISRLYRNHCIMQNNIFLKDLCRLGRDLQNTIIIDYDKRIFAKNTSNGFQCRWRGNQNDKSLLILSEILQEMINSKTNVSDTLTFYAEELFKIKGY